MDTVIISHSEKKVPDYLYKKIGYTPCVDCDIICCEMIYIFDGWSKISIFAQTIYNKQK